MPTRNVTRNCARVLIRVAHMAKRKTNWIGSWAGGRKYKAGKRIVYLLEKMRNGRRYTLKLAARDEEQAEKELAVFDRDPEGFRVAGAPRTVGEGALLLETDTIAAVIDWQTAQGQAPEHIYATALYLKQWAHHFDGRDVNTITISDCERALDAWGTARKMRIVALKTFCTWHVKRELLKNNPAAKLQVPKAIAAKHVEARNYSKLEIERAYAATDSQVQRDTIRLAISSGLHITEIERFATGIGKLVKVEGQGEIAGVLWVLHKSGKQHPNSIDAATFAAAERVRARGSIPGRPKRFEYAERVAQRLSERLTLELGKPTTIEAVQYGALRHSFITLARSAGGRIVRPVNFGVSLEEIRDAVGHRTTRTTEIYDGSQVPPMIVFPLDLTHPEDPPLKLVEPVKAARSRSGRPSTARGSRRS
ncbi:MAG: hypothetical protein QM817_13835 [Archangium sp.]